METKRIFPNRRSFLQVMASLAIGGKAFFRSGDLKAARQEAGVSVDNWPEMTYRILGRTGFNGSRLIFGCGAALSRGQAVSLLEPAFLAGINVFDVGFRGYYKDAEKNLAPFLKSRRDQIFLISKAILDVDVEPDQEISVSEARDAARKWLLMMDASLAELKVDHVNAYYLMATNNPSIVRSDEIYTAFLKAKDAGKVSHLGISTHENAEAVMNAAIETEHYDLMQIAITPAGWYDWNSRSLLDGSRDLLSLKPLLDKARKAGIGLIGMKAGRYLAGRGFLRGGNLEAYDGYYDQNLKAANLNNFQRSYAYVLAHGLDAVNADLQNYQILKENFIAATSAQKYFVT